MATHLQPTLGLNPKMAKAMHQQSKIATHGSGQSSQINSSKPYRPVLHPSSTTGTPQRSNQTVTAAGHRLGVSKSPQLRPQQQFLLLDKDRDRLIDYSQKMTHSSDLPDLSEHGNDKSKLTSDEQLQSVLQTAITSHMQSGQQNSNNIGFSKQNTQPIEEPTYWRQSRVNQDIHDQDIDPSLYIQAVQNCEHLYRNVQNLDWQLQCAKQMIQKYKDLVVGQQLKINAQAVSLGKLKLLNEKYEKENQQLSGQLSK